MFTKRIARETLFDIHEPTSLNGPLNYSPKTITATLTSSPWKAEAEAGPRARADARRRETPRGQ